MDLDKAENKQNMQTNKTTDYEELLSVVIYNMYFCMLPVPFKGK